MTEDWDEESSALLLIPIVLLFLAILCSFFIQRHNIHVLQPSAAAMVVGMVVGGIMKATGTARELRFSPGAFFYGLLPPIIYAAGLNLQRRDFFDNFFTICLFAFAGTLLSAFCFGIGTYSLIAMGAVDRSLLGHNPLLESLLYGTLISATDPVATLSIFADVNAPPLLYNIVFGESVLNDAVAVVLFRTLASFYSGEFYLSTCLVALLRFAAVSIGSIGVGVACALACAFTLKHLGLAAAPPDAAASYNGTAYALGFIFISGYFSYLSAESLGLSGIMSIFFTGIVNAHYSYHNVGAEAQMVVFKSVEAVAFLSETFVFAYLGLQVATFRHAPDAGLLVSGLPLSVLSRAANVFPLARAANYLREEEVPMRMQLMQWACGLRGAVAYALAVNMPDVHAVRHPDESGSPAIETATLAIVLMSTLILGGATIPLLDALGLRGGGSGGGGSGGGYVGGGGAGIGHLESLETDYEVYGGRVVPVADGTLRSKVLRAQAAAFAAMGRFEHGVMYPVFGGGGTADMGAGGSRGGGGGGGNVGGATNQFVPSSGGWSPFESLRWLGQTISVGVGGGPRNTPGMGYVPMESAGETGLDPIADDDAMDAPGIGGRRGVDGAGGGGGDRVAGGGATQRGSGYHPPALPVQWDGD